MIYLLRYGSTNRYAILNPADNSINFKGFDKEKLKRDFLNESDRGWYTTINFKLTAFYRINKEMYFSYGSFKVKIDSNIQFSLTRHSSFSFLNNLSISDGNSELLKLVYFPRRNLFKSFDTTLGQEDYDLDLITLAFYVITNEKIRARFKETGYY